MRKLLARLSQLSMVVGFFALLSDASGLHGVLRMRAPAAGAWWNAHAFYFMEGAATALGLLLALWIGVRLAAEADRLKYPAPIALAFEAALLLPQTHLCARIARIGADGTPIVAPGTIAGFTGFETGRFLGKLLIAAAYFFKTLAFAFLFGQALFGAVLAGAILLARGE